MHAGLPLRIAVGIEGELQESVAGGASVYQVLFGSILVGPQVDPAFSVINGALDGDIGVFLLVG